jgi:hypothetical protein
MYGGGTAQIRRGCHTKNGFLKVIKMSEMKKLEVGNGKWEMGRNEEIEIQT